MDIAFVDFSEGKSRGIDRWFLFGADQYLMMTEERFSNKRQTKGSSERGNAEGGEGFLLANEYVVVTCSLLILEDITMDGTLTIIFLTRVGAPFSM